jgi:hypothetical protein
MKVIAHRANLYGPDKKIENTPSQIEQCISQGYDCEIDVWYINSELYLGHDGPELKFELSFLLQHSEFLWIHCKNIEALQLLKQHSSLNCFYHTDEDYVLTTKGIIWVYPGKPVPDNAIVVMPEWHPDIKYDSSKIGGICTDYPILSYQYLI